MDVTFYATLDESTLKPYLPDLPFLLPPAPHMTTSTRTWRRAHRRRLGPVLPCATYSPPPTSAAVHALQRVVGPTRLSDALGFLRAQGCASVLANLGQAYLRQVDAELLERLLRNGRHDKAAQHFCTRFAERCFPLEYVWTSRRDGQLLVEVTSGIQHEGYGDNWEELGDLWSLRPVFLLSWALMEDPYGPLRDEFRQDELPDDEPRVDGRLCDEAREAIAHVAELGVDDLFTDVPADGFSSEYLRARLSGTQWEPLLWAAPWLWRVSGNPFLDRDTDDYPEPEAWSRSAVLYLSCAYREALRISRAIDAFDNWLVQAPAERIRAAILASLRPPTDRISTLVDLPIVDNHAECSCPRVSPAS